jgi:hypothetical protein
MFFSCCVLYSQESVLNDILIKDFDNITVFYLPFSIHTIAPLSENDLIINTEIIKSYKTIGFESNYLYNQLLKINLKRPESTMVNKFNYLNSTLENIELNDSFVNARLLLIITDSSKQSINILIGRSKTYIALNKQIFLFNDFLINLVCEILDYLDNYNIKNDIVEYFQE